MKVHRAFLFAGIVVFWSAQSISQLSDQWTNVEQIQFGGADVITEFGQIPGKTIPSDDFQAKKEEYKQYLAHKDGDSVADDFLKRAYWDDLQVPFSHDTAEKKNFFNTLDHENTSLWKKRYARSKNFWPNKEWVKKEAEFVERIKQASPDLDKIASLLADSEKICEDLPEIPGTPSTKVSFFCKFEADSSSTCYNAPPEFLIGSSGKIATAIAVAYRTKDGRDKLKQYYKDISSNPENIATSDKLMGEARVLMLSNSYIPREYVAPFFEPARVQRELNKGKILDSISQIESALYNEFKLTQKERPKELRLQQINVAYFNALQSCVHNHLRDGDAWSMDNLQKKMLQEFEGGAIVGPVPLKCCDSQNNASPVLEGAWKAALKSNALQNIDLNFPEGYVAYRESIGKPMSHAEVIDYMNLVALKKGLLQFKQKNEESEPYEGDEENHPDEPLFKIAINDPFYADKSQFVASYVLNEGFPQLDKQIVTRGSDAERSQARDALFKKMEEDYAEKNQAQAKNSIWKSDYLTVKKVSDTEVTIHFDPPDSGIDSSSRDLYIKTDSKNGVMLTYLVGGKKMAIPPNIQALLKGMPISP